MDPAEPPAMSLAVSRIHEVLCKPPTIGPPAGGPCYGPTEPRLWARQYPPSMILAGKPCYEPSEAPDHGPAKDASQAQRRFSDLPPPESMFFV